eukprot:365837-Chlamydomonas_euryale.AAC.9
MRACVTDSCPVPGRPLRLQSMEGERKGTRAIRVLTQVRLLCCIEPVGRQQRKRCCVGQKEGMDLRTRSLRFMMDCRRVTALHRHRQKTLNLQPNHRSIMHPVRQRTTRCATAARPPVQTPVWRLKRPPLGRPPAQSPTTRPNAASSPHLSRRMPRRACKIPRWCGT